MGQLPEWSLALRHQMIDYGISGAEIARRLGKSRQWVCGILTGNKVNSAMQGRIVACVDELIRERAQESA